MAHRIGQIMDPIQHERGFMTKQESEKATIDFIRLRAQGMSFDSISREIKVSKPALIKWAHLYGDKIREARADAWQAIKDEMRISVIDDLRDKAELYHRLKESLRSADITKLSIDKQYDLMIKLETEFEKLNLNYDTGIKKDAMTDFLDSVTASAKVSA